MNIDNLISSFDFDKLKNDCLIHHFLKTYIKKKIDSNLMLGFRYFGAIFKKSAMCFPSECESRVGMNKNAVSKFI